MDIYRNLPIQINYGVVIYDTNNLDSNGEAEVLHFVGLSEVPNQEEMDDICDEINSNSHVP